jgi:exosome complex component RRP41
VEDLYKKHQIEILVSVIQNEGSAKSAVLNCISLALVDAGICMKDLVVSCTVGTLQGLTVVDTNEEEEYELANEFVVSYLQGSGTLDCVSLRKAKVKEEGVRAIQKEAIASCQLLYQRFRKALLDYSIKKMLIF